MLRGESFIKFCTSLRHAKDEEGSLFVASDSVEPAQKLVLVGVVGEAWKWGQSSLFDNLKKCMRRGGEGKSGVLKELRVVSGNDPPKRYSPE
jgi:hypothetical protein